MGACSLGTKMIIAKPERSVNTFFDYFFDFFELVINTIGIFLFFCENS